MVATRAERTVGVAAATAHICCSQAYLFAAAENIQVHGGIGVHLGAPRPPVLPPR